MPHPDIAPDVLADLTEMQRNGWQKVYVITADRTPTRHIMWLQPDATAAHKWPQARAIFRESLTEAARECYGVKD